MIGIQLSSSECRDNKLRNWNQVKICERLCAGRVHTWSCWSQVIRCDWKNSESLNCLKYIIRKDMLGLTPPLLPWQSVPSYWEHTWHFVLTTSWNSFGNLLLVSLVVESWLPSCSECIQNIYLSRSFWFGGKGRSCAMPDPKNQVDEDTQ